MPHNVVYLAIGSNQGDRSRNIARSIKLLTLNPRIRIEKISSFYETSAVGGPHNQRNFYNAALKITTSYNPFDLLSFLQSVEKKLKRKTVQRWGPRTIDLDILFFEDLILMNKGLCIPHPRIRERKFVLKPLSDIAAGLKHPVHGKRVSYMLRKAHNNEETVSPLN